MEVDVRRGLPAFTLVGLPDRAVRESRERVRAAVQNSGLDFPMKRLTVNLAPAHVRKAGPGFDLAIAVGLLAASGQVPCEALVSTAVCRRAVAERRAPRCPRHPGGRHGRAGGRMRAHAGPAPERVARRRSSTASGDRSGRRSHEIAVLRGARASPSRSSSPAFPTMTARASSTCATFAARRTRSGRSRSPRPVGTTCSWSVRRGWARRCSPGACRASCRAPGLDEALEITQMHSAAGLGSGGARCASGRSGRRTTRSRRRAWSAAARLPRPGEVTLAHRGVLFLDELAEFSRHGARRAAPAARGGTGSTSCAGSARSSSRPIRCSSRRCNRCPCGRGRNACRCIAGRPRPLSAAAERAAARPDRPGLRGRAVPPLELAGAQRRRARRAPPSGSA